MVCGALESGAARSWTEDGAPRDRLLRLCDAQLAWVRSSFVPNATASRPRPRNSPQPNGRSMPIAPAPMPCTRRRAGSIATRHCPVRGATNAPHGVPSPRHPPLDAVARGLAAEPPQLAQAIVWQAAEPRALIGAHFCLTDYGAARSAPMGRRRPCRHHRRSTWGPCCFEQAGLVLARPTSGAFERRRAASPSPVGPRCYARNAFSGLQPLRQMDSSPPLRTVRTRHRPFPFMRHGISGKVDSGCENYPLFILL